MKGLFFRDLLALKSYGKMTVAMVAFYILLTVVSKEFSFLSTVIILFCSMIPLTSLSIDEQAKWGAYAQCMPVSRAQVVTSKYLLVMVAMAAGFLLSAIVCIAASAINGTPFRESIASLGITLCIPMLIGGISLPAMFKLGAEKARWVIMLAFGACSIPIIILLGNPDLLVKLLDIAQYALPGIAIVVFGGSFFLTRKIYQAKEL